LPLFAYAHTYFSVVRRFRTDTIFVGNRQFLSPDTGLCHKTFQLNRKIITTVPACVKVVLHNAGSIPILISNLPKHVRKTKNENYVSLMKPKIQIQTCFLRIIGKNQEKPFNSELAGNFSCFYIRL